MRNLFENVKSINLQTLRPFYGFYTNVQTNIVFRVQKIIVTLI